MTPTLTEGVFVAGLAAGLLNTAGILASALGISDYYPPGERDWRYVGLWGLSHVLSGSILAVGFLQRDALGLPRPAATVVGGAVVAIGFAVAVAAGRDLGFEETQGLRGELRTGGWYRYSRNPQYVGYLAATAAFPVLTGAPLTIPLCGIYVLWWLSFPFAEEPWLREQYGEEYERYAERVPRFVGGHTLRALAGGTDRPTAIDRN